jgi:hypothetical protein
VVVEVQNQLTELEKEHKMKGQDKRTLTRGQTVRENNQREEEKKLQKELKKDQMTDLLIDNQLSQVVGERSAIFLRRWALATITNTLGTMMAN